MQDIVAHHDEFLTQTVTQHQGDVAKQTGDGVFAVFPDPIGAIETALDAQKEFNSGEHLGALPYGLASGLPRIFDHITRIFRS